MSHNDEERKPGKPWFTMARPPAGASQEELEEWAEWLVARIKENAPEHPAEEGQEDEDDG